MPQENLIGHGMPGLADNVAESLEILALSHLQLRLVAGLMGDQLDAPRCRVRAHGIGKRLQVHAGRGPAYGAVGIRIEGMQQDGQFFSLIVPGDNAVTAAHRHTELLQLGSVYPGQGVQAGRVNELVMAAFQGVPLYVGRVFPAQEELGVEGEGGQE